MENGNAVKFVDLQINEDDKYFLLPEDSIILLLYARPERAIRGRTAMQKELFLMYEEVLKKKEFSQLKKVDPGFVPYKFGPFSFKVSSALASLIFRGKVAKIGIKNWEKFSITEDGEILASELLEVLPSTIISDLLEVLSIKRKGWDQLGRSGLISRTRMLFPQYYDLSKLGSRHSNALMALEGAERRRHKLSMVVVEALREVPQNEDYDRYKEDYYRKIDEKFGGEVWGKLYVELR